LTEQRTHFAMWCMLASPLMLGNDPRAMSAATLSILTAPDLLAINQDPLGRAAELVGGGRGGGGRGSEQ
jgi:alpha-galactosidase